MGPVLPARGRDQIGFSKGRCEMKPTIRLRCHGGAAGHNISVRAWVTARVGRLSSPAMRGTGNVRRMIEFEVQSRSRQRRTAGRRCRTGCRRCSGSRCVARTCRSCARWQRFAGCAPHRTARTGGRIMSQGTAAIGAAGGGFSSKNIGSCLAVQSTSSGE